MSTSFDTAKMSHSAVCKLINAVRKRNKLWVKENGLKRDYLNLLWSDVSAETKLPVDICRAKWSHLRDNFRKTYIRNCQYPGNQRAWKFYNEMSFMEEYVAENIQKHKLKSIYSKKSSQDNDASQMNFSRDCCSDKSFEVSSKRIKVEIKGECCSLNQDYSSECHEEDEYTTPDFDDFIQPIPIETMLNDESSSPVDQPNSTKKFEQDNLSNAYPSSNYNHVIPNAQTIDEKESDRLFLLSLLPYLNKVSNNRKLTVRQQIQSVLLNEFES